MLNSVWKTVARNSTMLGRWLKHSVAAVLLLACVFALIAIWWLGPRWQWGDHHPWVTLSARFAASAVLLLLPLTVWVSVLWRRNRVLEAERQRKIAAVGDPCLSYIEVQEASLEESLGLLRGQLDRRGYLYRLPWYLVLGRENAGKTSLVNRSGQNFAPTSVAKAGRPADRPSDKVAWWISNDAVLIDPPGEWISQANTAPSSERPVGLEGRLWTHLLDWLGRRRSRRPLNGVIVVVDVAELLTQSASDRQSLVVMLRTRLCELTARLGTRPPVYVVLSKLDLLEGFDAFAARLSPAQREACLGFTFSLKSVDHYDAWQAEFAQAYDAFLSQLNELVFDALAAQADRPQREGLVSLVRQLAGARSILASFLADVLGSDRFATPALVRGVYFSSVYQHGLLTNAFAHAVGPEYDLPDLVHEAKPDNRPTVYFAQPLFGGIVYREAGLAGDNVHVIAAKRRLLAAGFAAAGLGSLLVIGGWQHYFDVNRDAAHAVLQRVQSFATSDVPPPTDPTGRNLLPSLGQLRNALSIYGNYRHAWPGVADMGLYQGRIIGPTVDAAYLRLLSTYFLPELANGVLAAVEAAPPQSDQRLAALRVYRMIEDRANRRPEFVETWMVRRWQTAFPADGATQDALMHHLDYALQYADTNLPQQAAVVQAQRELRRIPLQQRVYMALKQQAEQQGAQAPLDLRNEVGPAFDIVFQPIASGEKAGDGTPDTLIDPLLTARGFRHDFEPRSKDLADLAMIDEWVLGERGTIAYSDEDKKVLAERIRTLYAADYIASWRRALSSIDVVDVHSVDQAVQVLETVTGPSAPFRRLLEAVRDNTSSLAVSGTVPAEKAVVLPALDEEDIGQSPAARIARAFAPLSGLLIVKGDHPSYLDETMAALQGLLDYLKAIQGSPERGKAALGAVMNRFTLSGPDPIGEVQRIANGLPAPLDRDVRKLADQSAQVLTVEALRELERRWDAEVYQFYAQRLASRYPFDSASRVDASLQDFEAFFGPKGVLQQFEDQYLKVFLKDNLDALRTADGSLVRQDVLTQLDAADRIRDAFINERGALSVPFTIEPLGLTPNRRSSVLNVDGQIVTYDHGPSVPVGLLWPNVLDGDVQSNVTLVNDAGGSAGLVYRGPWSLFRLLSQAHLNGSTPDSVDLSFDLGDGAMRYRIRADKANNPFTQMLFAGFVLPRRLLNDSPDAEPSANKAQKHGG